MIYKAESGFVGIASILIVTVLIGVWLYYFSPLAGSKPPIEQERSIGVDAIQKAKNTRVLIETHDYGL